MRINRFIIACVLLVLLFALPVHAYDAKCRIIYADWDAEHKAAIGKFKFINTVLIKKQGTRAVAWICVDWGPAKHLWQNFIQPYIDNNPSLDFRYWEDGLEMYQDSTGTPSGERIFMEMSTYPVDVDSDPETPDEHLSLWHIVNTPVYGITKSIINQNRHLIIWGHECLRIP